MGDLVLVVDDQAELLELVVKHIEQLGLKTISACNASEGLAHFRKHRPSLVISDCYMPGLEETEHMVRAIRSEARQTTIIMMSGSPNLSLEWALDLGADSFMEKPFRPEAFENIILEVYGPKGV
ncbi:MAG: response regulator [Bacteriovoracia bacterium]